jgi:serine/threonine protein kinase
MELHRATETRSVESDSATEGRASTIDSAGSGPRALAILQGKATLHSAPRIPEYEIVRCIGHGSYGEVWLARSVLGEFRAVKVVYRDSFDHDKPYEREFEGLKKFEPVSHARESQVDIFHVGRNDQVGFFYYVMELADPALTIPNLEMRNPKEIRDSRAEKAGVETALRSSDFGLRNPDLYTPRTLKHDLRIRGALPFAEALRIALSLTRALEHLHTHGLVHRDIKPSNIIFVRGIPKLADIGLVTSVDATRSFVGTDGYIPPEGPGTPQADLYSFGKVLYECVTGKDRLEFPELPVDWRNHPDYQPLLELNEILTKACDANPAERYASAQAMYDELALLNTGGSVKRKRTFGRRWRLARTIALAAILLAVLTVNALLLLRRFTPSDVPGEGPPSTNTLANILCEKAMGIIRSDDYARFAEASTNFNKAIELDPWFARPYAGLLKLRTREWSPSVKRMSNEELQSLASKLNDLGPDLAATYCARAIVSYGHLDFPQAKKLILKAIAADPKYEFAHTTYGFWLMSWGWPIQAREQLRISAQIDASKVTIYCFRGHTYHLERDYTNAIDSYQTALRFEQQHAWSYGGLADTYEGMGDYTNAIANHEKQELLSGEDESATRRDCNDRLRAFKEGGARGYYRQLWKEAETDPGEFYWKACIQIHLGNTNTALNYLSKAFQARANGSSLERNLNYLLVHEHWDPVRDDPRFKELLKTNFWEVMPKRK